MSATSIRIAKLGEISEITMGNSPPGESYNSNGVGTPLVNGPVEFGDGALGRTVKSKWTTEPSKFCGEGDLLICVRGSTTGRTNVADFDACIGRGVASVKAFEHQGYLNRFLTTRRREIFNSGKGSTFPSISRDQLASLEIPLPPLAEQKRIAGILHAADALRAKRRETLAQLDTLLQATFLDLFGDPVTNPKGWDLGVVGDLLQSANYGTSKKADENVEGVPILRMNNIMYSGEWDFNSLKYIDLDKKELTKYLVWKGQILFNRTNSKELVGKTAVYRRNEPMAFAGYLVRAIVKSNADPEYVGAFMNTPQTKQYLKSKCKSIVGMANINAKEFQAIPMPTPPFDLQRQFGLFVAAVESQKVAHRSHLAELDTLFASLQSRAFRGEL